MGPVLSSSPLTHVSALYTTQIRTATPHASLHPRKTQRQVRDLCSRCRRDDRWTVPGCQDFCRTVEVHVSLAAVAVAIAVLKLYRYSQRNADNDGSSSASTTATATSAASTSASASSAPRRRPSILLPPLLLLNPLLGNISTTLELVAGRSRVRSGLLASSSAATSTGS